jgi:hypothetical protein
MRIRLLSLAAAASLLLPASAFADATVFLGTTTSPTRQSVKGFSVGMSLLVVGFEFEYASTSADDTQLTPSLKTTSGNASVQTFGLPFQLYATTGGGFYRERLGPAQETNFVLNTGGGVKFSLFGPIRARIDYRIFNLKGNPQHSKVQRLYAGLNLAF